MSDALPFITGEQIAALVTPGDAIDAIVDALDKVDPADEPATLGH